MNEVAELLQARLKISQAESHIHAAMEMEKARGVGSSRELLDHIRIAGCNLLFSRDAVKKALKQWATNFPASSMPPEEILELLDILFHDGPSDEIKK